MIENHSSFLELSKTTSGFLVCYEFTRAHHTEDVSQRSKCWWCGEFLSWVCPTVSKCRSCAAPLTLLHNDHTVLIFFSPCTSFHPWKCYAFLHQSCLNRWDIGQSYLMVCSLKLWLLAITNATPHNSLATRLWSWNNFYHDVCTYK